MDPDIAPLARRLAEENNVDWRRLQGSGSDGRIVERDVLDYLARVMAGDEAVDPTPEPLPDGMEAWPEEAGADEDAYAGAENAASDDDLLLAGDDLVAGDEEDQDDLLLAGTEAATPEPRDESPDLFDEIGSAEAERSSAPDLFLDEGDDVSGTPADRGRADFDFGGLPGAGEDAAPAAPREGALADADALTFGDADAASVPADEPAAPASHEPAPEAGAGAPTPHGERSGAGDALAGGAAAADEAAPREPAGHEAAHERAHEAVPPRPDVPPAVAAETHAEAGGETRGLPLARSRTVLRRHLDVGSALAVRRSVALEAGRDDVPVAALVLAAARRAADRLDVARPGVAVPAPGGRMSVVVPAGEGLAAIAAAMDAAASEVREDEGADLWVVDLSGVGIDEAVLDVDAPQLVLGRLLSDADDGSVRATMSLVADVPVERGAAFLARVADLLEDPLRLLA
jgi:hypothetical protein